MGLRYKSSTKPRTTAYIPSIRDPEFLDFINSLNRRADNLLKDCKYIERELEKQDSERYVKIHN